MSFVNLSTSTWAPIGPAPVQGTNAFPVAGRIQAAAPHPTDATVLYLAADNGGVWRNVDPPGWIALTDDQPSLNFTAIHALVVHPANTNLVVGAVSGPGAGILRSLDGGGTWQLLANSLFDGMTLSAIAVHPTSTQILYLAAGWNGVYKSSDGGVNWRRQTTLPDGYVSDLIVARFDANVVYAAVVGNGGAAAAHNGIYESVDGGATWHASRVGLPSTSALGPGSCAILDSGLLPPVLVAVVPRQGVVYCSILTADASGNVTAIQRFSMLYGSNSWTALAATPGSFESRAWHLLLAVDPSNANHVFANDQYSLYESTNGGQAWSRADAGEGYPWPPPYGGTNPFDWVNAAFDANGDVIATADQGVFRYRPQNQQWTLLNANLQTTELYTITLDHNDAGVVYGVGQDQLGVMKSFSLPGSDVFQVASVPWNYLSAGGGETGKILVDPDDSTQLYFYNPLSPNDFVRRSSDGGQTWTTIASGHDVDTADAYSPGGNYGLAYTSQKAFVIDPSNSARVLLGTTHVIETTNAQDATPTWTGISDVLAPAGQYITVLAIAPSDDQTIYAATQDGHVWIANDGSTAWAQCDTGLFGVANQSVSELRVDPRDNYHAFAVTGSWGGTNVWELTVQYPGGTLTLPLPAPVFTWTNISAGFPRNVGGSHSLAVDWSYSIPSLYVGTDRGVYQSVDRGSTWTAFGAGLPNTSVNDLQLVSVPPFGSQSETVLAAGTYGRGAWEILLQPSSVSGRVFGTVAGKVPNTMVGIYVGGVTVDGNGFIVLWPGGGIGPVGPEGPLDLIGLAGVTVFLDVNGNGSPEKSKFQTTTDAHGRYTFDRVPPGTYTVTQLCPPGYAQFKPAFGGVTVNGSRLEELHFHNVPLASLPFHIASARTLAGVAGGINAQGRPLSAPGEEQMRHVKKRK